MLRKATEGSGCGPLISISRNSTWTLAALDGRWLSSATYPAVSFLIWDAQKVLACVHSQSGEVLRGKHAFSVIFSIKEQLQEWPLAHSVCVHVQSTSLRKNPVTAVCPSPSGSQGPVCVSFPLGNRALPWLPARLPLQALSLGFADSAWAEGRLGAGVKPLLGIPYGVVIDGGIFGLHVP